MEKQSQCAGNSDALEPSPNLASSGPSGDRKRSNLTTGISMTSQTDFLALITQVLVAYGVQKPDYLPWRVKLMSSRRKRRLRAALRAHYIAAKLCDSPQLKTHTMLCIADFVHVKKPHG